MYMRLLRDSVAGISLAESELTLVEQPGKPGLLHKRKLDIGLRRAGKDWPWLGMTRIGLTRLNNVLQALLTAALREVPGQCAVWQFWMDLRFRAQIYLSKARDACNTMKITAWKLITNGLLQHHQ